MAGKKLSRHQAALQQARARKTNCIKAARASIEAGAVYDIAKLAERYDVSRQLITMWLRSALMQLVLRARACCNAAWCRVSFLPAMVSSCVVAAREYAGKMGL